MIPKQLPNAKQAMERFLESETLGFLGLAKEGKPYVVPMTYAYRKGKILIHCACTGLKLDYIKANPCVCFTVGTQSGRTIRHPCGATCLSDHDSVICYGTARIVDDLLERHRTLAAFNRRLVKRPRPIPLKAVEGCLAAEITVTKMTLRQKRKGAEWTAGEYSFQSKADPPRTAGRK